MSRVIIPAEANIHQFKSVLNVYWFNQFFISRYDTGVPIASVLGIIVGIYKKIVVGGI
jgi:hypothetical protein